MNDTQEHHEEQDRRVFTFDSIRDDYKIRVQLLVTGRKPGETKYKQVDDHNGNNYLARRIPEFLPLYDQLPQATTSKQQWGEEEGCTSPFLVLRTKSDVINKVNEDLFFLRSVDNHDGTLSNMEWTQETNETVIAKKTQQKFRDEKKKQEKKRKDDTLDPLPKMSHADMKTKLEAIENNACLGYLPGGLEVLLPTPAPPPPPTPPPLPMERGDSDAICDGLGYEEAVTNIAMSLLQEKILKLEQLAASQEERLGNLENGLAREVASLKRDNAYLETCNANLEERVKSLEGGGWDKRIRR
jgi:hypothetical protein